MRRPLPRLVLLAWLAALSLAAAAVAAPPSRPAYPPSRQVETVDTLHGQPVPDPYRWLEDARSPEVQAWMKAQDALARQVLAKMPGRAPIVKRLRELLYVDTMGLPQHLGGRYFYSRRKARLEKAIVCWRQGLNGPERVLFDPNKWSKDGSMSLGDWSVSWDGRKVAYQVHKNNSDEATLYLADVDTGKKSTIDVIEGAKYASASWTPDNKAFYYTWIPTDPKISAAERPGYAEIRFHRLGQDPRKDEIVRERTGDPTTFLGAGLSRDGHWLLVYVQHGWRSADVYFRDTRPGAKDKTFKPLAVGKDANFDVNPWKDRFYVRTNLGAPFYRLYRVDPAHPEMSAWKEIVPARKGATLQSAAIVGNHLALRYLESVASRLEIATLDGKVRYRVATPGLGTVGGMSGNEDEDQAWFSFTSFTVPAELYEFSVASGRKKLWFRPKLPVDPSRFVVSQVFARSKDGTRVPMFVIGPRGFKKTGHTPTILYGYGGFQSSITPQFMSSVVPWVEAGNVYVIANLRGGGEFGEEWHREGMLLKKQNVFDDFAACAELLQKQGYTDREHLAIRGGSNGGLLVGALMTQRPELCGVVLCAVPLLDMVRYHLFGSGKTWIQEYGSADDAAQFKVLFGYSPYHHVKKGVAYPAVLMDSADSDDRVDPMHARKFVAMLQNDSTGGPVLLRIERNAGHGGADMLKATIERLADQYVFTYAQMGIVPRAPGPSGKR